MELIKIENINGNLVVSSRVVAEQLGKRHSDVLNKIKEVCNEREFSLVEYTDAKGESRPEALLTKDGFILLCMNYQGYNDFKRAYINKFNEMERELNQFRVPKTYLEAVKELAVVLEEKEAVEKLAIEQKRTIDTLVHTNKLYTTTEIAKELNLKSANELNKMLSDMKIQFKQNGTWILYSNYSNLGLVSIKQNILENGKIVYDRKWTIEGRKFILDLFTSKSISA